MSKGAIENNRERTGIVAGNSKPSMQPYPGASLWMFDQPFNPEHDADKKQEEWKISTLYAGIDEQKRVKMIERQNV